MADLEIYVNGTALKQAQGANAIVDTMSATVCFPQSKGNPVYIPLYHIAAKLVLINMGGDKLS